MSVSIDQNHFSWLCSRMIRSFEGKEISFQEFGPNHFEWGLNDSGGVSSSDGFYWFKVIKYFC